MGQRQEASVHADARRSPPLPGAGDPSAGRGSCRSQLAGSTQKLRRCERFQRCRAVLTRGLPAVSGTRRGLGRIRPVAVMARPPFDSVLVAPLPDATLPDASLLAAPVTGWWGHEVAHQDEYPGAQDSVAHAEHADRGERDDVTEEL